MSNDIAFAANYENLATWKVADSPEFQKKFEAMMREAKEIIHSGKRARPDISAAAEPAELQAATPASAGNKDDVGNEAEARCDGEAAKIRESMEAVQGLDKPVKVAFIMPMWNEMVRLSPKSGDNPSGQDALRKKVAELDALRKINNNFDWRLMAIDDNTAGLSAKRIEEIREEIAQEWGRDVADRVTTQIIKPEEKPAGSRKGSAVLKGLAAAMNDGWADYIGYTDVDTSIDMRQAGLLLEALRKEDAGAAIGSRWCEGAQAEGIPISGIISSRVYNLCVRMMLPALAGIKDTQRGFKLFTRDAMEMILPRASDVTLAFDTELLLLAKLSGYRIKEVPIAWIDSPSLRTFKALEEAPKMLLSLWKQRRHMRAVRQNRPRPQSPPPGPPQTLHSTPLKALALQAAPLIVGYYLGPVWMAALAVAEAFGYVAYQEWRRWVTRRAEKTKKETYESWLRAKANGAPLPNIETDGGGGAITSTPRAVDEVRHFVIHRKAHDLPAAIVDNIRPARPEDAAAIYGLYFTGFKRIGSEWNKKRNEAVYRDLAVRNQAAPVIWVYSDKGSVRGYIFVVKKIDGSVGVSEIVSADDAPRGVGKSLWAVMMSHMEARGAEKYSVTAVHTYTANIAMEFGLTCDEAAGDKSGVYEADFSADRSHEALQAADEKSNGKATGENLYANQKPGPGLPSNLGKAYYARPPEDANQIPPAAAQTREPGAIGEEKNGLFKIFDTAQGRALIEKWIYIYPNAGQSMNAGQIKDVVNFFADSANRYKNFTEEASVRFPVLESIRRSYERTYQGLGRAPPTVTEKESLFRPYITGTVVADVGCGWNTLGAEIIKNNPRIKQVVGIDIEDQTKGHVDEGVSFKLMDDPLSLPMSDASVDTVILSFVLHHLQVDTTRFLQEVKRVLRSGGRIIVLEDTFSRSTKPDRVDELSEAFSKLPDDADRLSFLWFVDWFNHNFINRSRQPLVPGNYKTMDRWSILFENEGFDTVAERHLGFAEIGSKNPVNRGFFVFEKSVPAEDVNQILSEVGQTREPGAASDSENRRGVSAVTPAEVLREIRDDDQKLAAALGDGVEPSDAERPTFATLADVGVFDKIGDSNFRLAEMMRGPNAKETRNRINVVTAVMSKEKYVSSEILRAHIVDYAYTQIKEVSIAEKQYKIKMWKGYAAPSQANLVTQIRRWTEDAQYKVSFDEIGELVSFACNNVDDATVTILPLNMLDSNQVVALKNANARVIYINLEGQTIKSDDLTNLQGLVGTGKAYLNDDEESFYRLYRLLAKEPSGESVALADLKTNPVLFIDQLRFILRPITAKDPQELHRTRETMEELLKAA